MHLNPTQYVVKCFGGVRKTAKAIGRSPAAICQWNNRGGSIPSAAQLLIIKAAKKRKIKITPDDLILGRKI